MPSGVSVERAAVQGGIGCCRTAMHELEAASSTLKRDYQKAGSGGWRDQKHAALGGIIEECCSALTKPISELEVCKGKLEELLKAIISYEQVNL